VTPARPAQLADEEPARLVVELTNRCNLRCAYCVRDDDALHRDPARFFPADLLRRVVREARAACGVRHVAFTGGEPTLHPRFGEMTETVAAEGLEYSFVTNGWTFERVFPVLEASRSALKLVAFSLDGATAEAHDRWRGRGSFVRVVQAVTRCYRAGVPFIFKVAVRRDTVGQMERIALFAARLGAAALHFSHLLPTSGEAEDELALTFAERERAEQEIGALATILKMPVALAVGFYDLNPAPPCSPLRGTSYNVDYRGRLTLCCNLSGYRGAAGEADVAADLNEEDFAAGYERLRRVAAAQLERRALALAALARAGERDVYTGSPCLFCLRSFGKIPWRAAQGAVGRALPVLPGSAGQIGELPYPFGPGQSADAM
jgi:MoaA/NifB/PqqE/SkfB family radical SAM enzyme